MLPAVNVERTVVLEMQESVNGRVSYHISAAAISAITSVGTALGEELLSKEAEATVSSVSCLYINSYCINHKFAFTLIMVIRGLVVWIL
jgi:hypothetical protein